MGEQEDDTPIEDFEYGSPRHPHFPYMYEARPSEHYDEGGVISLRSFDPEGEGYDYRTARLAGLQPDETGHWPSRDPQTGMLLKGRRHPTFDLGVEHDRRMGYGLEKQGGRYYSQPFGR